jgi:adenylosuccinate synthase
MLFPGELKEFRQTSGMAKPRITMDPRAYVTTPWDMMINQSVEIARGADRHGSCGVGFGEAIERHEIVGLKLTFADLHGDQDRLMGLLMKIRDVYLAERLAKLGVELPAFMAEVAFTDGFMLAYLEDIASLKASIRQYNDGDLLDLKEQILFEGAQGLELDQDYGVFPHVTRSNTGLTNMVEIALEAGIECIRPVYMTRSYRTRHGAGPMKDASSELRCVTVVDKTNVDNQWQGSIQYAPLNLPALAKAIEHDIGRVSGKGVKIEATLGVSCLDQIFVKTVVQLDQFTTQMCTPQMILAELKQALRMPIAFASYGPSRDKVRPVAKLQFELNAAPLKI